MMYAAWTSAINSSFPVSVYKDGSDSGVNLNFKLYSEVMLTDNSLCKLYIGWETFKDRMNKTISG